MQENSYTTLHSQCLKIVSYHFNHLQRGEKREIHVRLLILSGAIGMFDELSAK